MQFRNLSFMVNNSFMTTGKQSGGEFTPAGHRASSIEATEEAENSAPRC